LKIYGSENDYQAAFRTCLAFGAHLWSWRAGTCFDRYSFMVRRDCSAEFRARSSARTSRAGRSYTDGSIRDGYPWYMSMRPYHRKRQLEALKRGSIARLEISLLRSWFHNSHWARQLLAIWSSSTHRICHHVFKATVTFILAWCILRT